MEVSNFFFEVNIKMPRKVLRTQIKAVCNNCNHCFNVNEAMKDQEEWWAKNNSSIPFRAKSSSTTMFCPKCAGDNFGMHYEYQNIYRIRCQDCKEMFNSQETYNKRCPKCEKDHILSIARLGA